MHRFRRGAGLELHTDARAISFGCVLLQEDENKILHTIYYMCRKITPIQEEYCSYESKTLAIIESVKKSKTTYKAQNLK